MDEAPGTYRSTMIPAQHSMICAGVKRALCTSVVIDGDYLCAQSRCAIILVCEVLVRGGHVFGLGRFIGSV